MAGCARRLSALTGRLLFDDRAADGTGLCRVTPLLDEALRLAAHGYTSSGSVASVRYADGSTGTDRSHVRLEENDLRLSVGRSTRVVPRRIRRALRRRDRGCAFPGCVVPAQWTDAHHIVHRVEGGPTGLANLVLLCPSHHTVLHQSAWSPTGIARLEACLVEHAR